MEPTSSSLLSSTPISKWTTSFFILALSAIFGLAFFLTQFFNPFPPPQPPQTQLSALPILPETPLEIAGSGSNLPLTRILAAHFLQHHSISRHHVRIHRSIGTKGAWKAVCDGNIHLGLLSRALRPNEECPSLVAIPYAKVAIVFAVHPSVPIQKLSHRQLLDIYQGKQETWPNQEPIRVLLREEGDSGNQALFQAIPTLHQIHQSLYKTKRWPVVYRDQAMQQALLQTRGAIGLFDLGAIRSQKLPLRPLTLQKTAPTRKAQRNRTHLRPTTRSISKRRNRLPHRSYPHIKTLFFAYSRSLPSTLRHRFLRFVFSQQGRQLIQKNGYFPHSPMLPSTQSDPTAP